MPTPQTGGLAVVGSVVISLVLAASILAITQPAKPVLPKGMASGSVWIVTSMLLIFVVSFIDDWVGLPAILRLGIQAGSACIIIGDRADVVYYSNTWRTDYLVGDRCRSYQCLRHSVDGEPL